MSCRLVANPTYAAQARYPVAVSGARGKADRELLQEHV
jgi:hypothetical protein